MSSEPAEGLRVVSNSQPTDRSLASRPKKKARTTPQAAVKAPVAVPAALEGAANPLVGSEVEANPSYVSEKLEELEDQARNTYLKLESLVRDFLLYKLILGDVLARAKECCFSVRGAWTAFLARVRIPERTAREAIEFHENRELIEELRRQPRILTVTDVRAVLKQQKESRSETSDPRVNVSNPETHAAGDVAASTETTVLVPRSEVTRTADSRVTPKSVVASRAETVEGDGLDRKDSGDSNHSSPSFTATLSVDADIVEFCRVFLESVELAIADSRSGVRISNLDALRESVPKMIAGLQRLESTLAALDESEA